MADRRIKSIQQQLTELTRKDLSTIQHQLIKLAGRLDNPIQLHYHISEILKLRETPMCINTNLYMKIYKGDS